MEGLVYLIIVFFTFLLLVVLPIVLAILLNRFIKKKVYNPKARFISLIPIIIAICFIYSSLYPSNSYYRNIYKQVTGIDFPTNARLLYKYSSDPTFLEGENLMLIKIGRDEYEKLTAALLNKNFEKEVDHKSYYLSGFEIENEFEIPSELTIRFVLAHSTIQYIYKGVAFLSDGETIVVKKICP